MRLAERVAVVTGAASGIGRALSLALGREGARLGLLDLKQDGLQSLAVDLEKAGARCATATVDVRDRQATRSAVEAVAAQLGPVDLLVACAGITGMTRVADLDVELTERLLEVNLLGPANAIDAMLPGMLERGSGQIAVISSLAGCRGMPFSAGYCASKAGLTRYLEGLRPSLARRGIAVTTILPGAVRTPLWQSTRVVPPGSMIEPEAAAQYILKAILRKKRVCAFPFSTSLAIRLVGWIPAGLYDFLVSRIAHQIADVEE